MWEVTYYSLLRPLALNRIWTEGKSPTVSGITLISPSPLTGELVGPDQHKALAQGYKNLVLISIICCRVHVTNFNYSPTDKESATIQNRKGEVPSSQSQYI